MISTSEAAAEVLGTQLAVSRDAGRTRVAVAEGNVRLTRFSDGRSVTLAAGQAAEVSVRADLRPAPLGETPDHWSLDFGDGLPEGWQTGQLVFDDLPEGSKAAVRAAGVVEHGKRRYHLRSHNAWTDGLFALHDDTWIHVRYRLERPGTFLLYLVCRQRDFGEPVATVLTPGNLRQTEAGRWHTLTLSMSGFHQARAGDAVPLDGQLVAFLLVFDSPEHNPGLTLERIWVTRGTPADPRPPIEPHRMSGSLRCASTSHPLTTRQHRGVAGPGRLRPRRGNPAYGAGDCRLDDAKPRYHMRAAHPRRNYAVGSGHFRENVYDPAFRDFVPFAAVWRSANDHAHLAVASYFKIVDGVRLASEHHPSGGKQGLH